VELSAEEEVQPFIRKNNTDKGREDRGERGDPLSPDTKPVLLTRMVSMWEVKKKGG